MISWLWLIPTFFAGGILGFLAMALCVAAGNDEQAKDSALYRSVILKLVGGIQEEELEQGMYPSIEVALVDAVKVLSK